MHGRLTYIKDIFISKKFCERQNYVATINIFEKIFTLINNISVKKKRKKI